MNGWPIDDYQWSWTNDNEPLRTFGCRCELEKLPKAIRAGFKARLSQGLVDSDIVAFSLKFWCDGCWSI